MDSEDDYQEVNNSLYRSMMAYMNNNILLHHNQDHDLIGYHMMVFVLIHDFGLRFTCTCTFINKLLTCICDQQIVKNRHGTVHTCTHCKV